MSLFSSFNISASGLSVQRRRIDTIAKNLANVNTTKTDEGGPYKREIAVIKERKPKGSFNSILERLTSRLVTTHSDHFKSTAYKRQHKPGTPGVEINEIAKDNSAPLVKYDPQHPDADENGYVRLPNINVITEMVDMIGAARAYEANLTVVSAAKNIIKKSLEI